MENIYNTNLELISNKDFYEQCKMYSKVYNIGFDNKSIDFDGYRTYFESSKSIGTEEFQIDMIFAIRYFEACHGNVLSTLVNQFDEVKNEGFFIGYDKNGYLTVIVGTGQNKCQYISKEKLKRVEFYKLSVVFESRKVTIVLNSNIIGEIRLNQTLKLSTNKLYIGKNNKTFTINVFEGGMFCGLISYFSLSKGINMEFNSPDSVVANKFDITLEEMYIVDTVKDEYRPKFHLVPPRHWMNEPHAPVYYKGKYHLFYQQNGVGPYWSHLHWGHWSSLDLIKWKHEPTAIFPEEGEVSPDGIWTGSAISKETELYLFFTYGRFGEDNSQGVAIATQRNPKDIDVKEMKIFPKRVIDQNIPMSLHGEFRDPFVFFDKDSEKYFLLIGGGKVNEGGSAFVYSSNDLYNWEQKGNLFDSNYFKFPFLGTHWELPVLLPIYEKNIKKYIFLISPCGKGADIQTYYWIGDFDPISAKFNPMTETPQKFDYGDFMFTGPSGMYDEKTNQTILFSIHQDHRSEEEHYVSGWAHSAGMPIELWLENFKLRFRPIKQFDNLRKKIIEEKSNISELRIEAKYKMLDININFNDKLSFKFEIYDGDLIVQIDPSKLTVSRRDSINKSIEKNDVAYFTSLDTNDLRIIIDHSAIEVYVNNEVSITTRSYFKSSVVNTVTLNSMVSINNFIAYTIDNIFEGEKMSEKLNAQIKALSLETCNEYTPNIMFHHLLVE